MQVLVLVQQQGRYSYKLCIKLCEARLSRIVEDENGINHGGCLECKL